jgi:hypothetical protein
MGAEVANMRLRVSSATIIPEDNEGDRQEAYEDCEVEIVRHSDPLEPDSWLRVFG